PAAPGREIVLWQRRKRLAADDSLTPPRRDSALSSQMMQWDLRAHVDPWYHFFTTYDPRVTARQVSAPALVLQGDADDTVPPEGADDLVSSLRPLSHDVSLKRFPGLAHAFLRSADLVDDDPASPAAVRLPAIVRGAITDWLAARLGGAIEGPAPHVSRRRHHH